jgi:hypothetical protein
MIGAKEVELIALKFVYLTNSELPPTVWTALQVVWHVLPPDWDPHAPNVSLLWDTLELILTALKPHAPLTNSEASIAPPLITDVPTVIVDV